MIIKKGAKLLEQKLLQGLTLIEMLVVLTILAIMLTFAVPSFLSLYQEYRLTAMVEHLYQTLQFARSSAIKNNQPIYVVFQTGDNWCYGVNASTSCSCNMANSCTLANVATARGQDLTLSTTGLTGNIFTFEGTHGASNVTATINFTLYGQSKSVGVRIKPLGNMQVCSSTVSGYPACT